MDALANDYGIKLDNSLLCLNDVATKMIETTNRKLFLSKIKEKTKIGKDYYVTGETLRSLLERSRTDGGRKAYRKLIEFETKKSSLIVTKQPVNITSDVIVVDNTNKLTNLTSQIVKTDDWSYTLNYDNVDVHLIVVSMVYWFKASNICKLLGYEDPTKGYKFVSDENASTYKKISTSQPNWRSSSDTTHIKSNTIYVNYPGFYELCMLSKKPKAKEFRKWIANDVIPSIEKTGSYILPENENIPTPYLNKKYVDLNNYVDAKCVYVLHVCQNLYKFGWTGNIIQRTQRHDKNYQSVEVIEIFQMDVIDDCLTMEDYVKNFCGQKRIRCGNVRQKELLDKKKLDPDSELVSNSKEMFETTPQLSIDDVLKQFLTYVVKIKKDRKKIMLLAGNGIDVNETLNNSDLSDDIKLKLLKNAYKRELEFKKIDDSKENDIELKKLDNEHILKQQQQEHNFELQKLQLQYQIELVKSGQIIQQPIQPLQQLSTLQIQKSTDKHDIQNDYSDNESQIDYSDNESQIECPESPVENLPTKTIPMINLPIFPPKSPQKTKQIEKLPTKINKTQPDTKQTTEKEDEPIDILSEIDEYFEEIDIDEPIIAKSKSKQTEKKPTKKTTTKQTTKKAEIKPTEKVEMPRSKFAILQNIHKPKKLQKETERTNECCGTCGNPLTAFRNRCDHCPSLKRFQEAIERGNRPSFLTLKKDLESMSMVAVGKKYGVSDNCIKKWLNKYIKYDQVNT